MLTTSVTIIATAGCDSLFSPPPLPSSSQVLPNSSLKRSISESASSAGLKSCLKSTSAFSFSPMEEEAFASFAHLAPYTAPLLIEGEEVIMCPLLPPTKVFNKLRNEYSRNVRLNMNPKPITPGSISQYRMYKSLQHRADLLRALPEKPLVASASRLRFAPITSLTFVYDDQVSGPTSADDDDQSFSTVSNKKSRTSSSSADFLDISWLNCTPSGAEPDFFRSPYSSSFSSPEPKPVEVWTMSFDTMEMPLAPIDDAEPTDYFRYYLVPADLSEVDIMLIQTFTDEDWEYLRSRFSKPKRFPKSNNSHPVTDLKTYSQRFNNVLYDIRFLRQITEARNAKRAQNPNPALTSEDDDDFFDLSEEDLSTSGR
jgi:hypothetical protein